MLQDWLKKVSLVLFPPLKRLREDRNNWYQSYVEAQHQLHNYENEREELIDQLFVWSRFFYHALPATPVRKGIFTEQEYPIVGLDNRFMKRLAAALEFGERFDKSSPNQYVWDILVKTHEPIVRLVRQNDTEAATLYLKRMAEQPLTHGYLQGEKMSQRLLNNEQQRSFWANLAYDALLCLAGALECLPVENIGVNTRAPIDSDAPDRLLDAVSLALDFELEAPPVLEGLFGLPTRRGVFTFRHFMALYVAWRLSEKFPDRQVRLGEIGGGVGFVAYYAWQLGFRDYFLIDLPSVNLAQSWFLHHALPDAPLRLSSEADLFSLGPAVRIVSSGFLDLAPEKYFDAIINIDSLPEIASEIVADYIASMQKRTRLFFSINHEARPPIDGDTYLNGLNCENRTSSKRHVLRQEPVAWHMNKFQGIHRLSRNRAWLRPGYIEEWYEFDNCNEKQ